MNTNDPNEFTNQNADPNTVNTVQKTEPAALYCSNCGRQIPPDSIFCNYCATPVAAAKVDQQPYGAPADPQSNFGAYAHDQSNTMGSSFTAQGAMNDPYQYQPNAPYNNQAGNTGFGGYQFSAYNAFAMDPRYKQFQVSNLQPGQREIVRCTQVSKSYGSSNALNPLNLVIGNGRVIGLLGPNGSGKTTLIKLMCGLLTPTTGTITINSTPIGAATKAMVSYLPDRTYIPDWMKIRNILDYFCDFYADFRRPLAETMLGNLHIDPNAVMKTLSKGTQEKVQLVLVMSRNASLYLLDEPIAGVDPVARDYILDTIIRAHNPDSSVVISTHLITDIEPALNEVIMIKYGSLALQGDADQLRRTFGKSLNDIFKEVFAGC